VTPDGSRPSLVVGAASLDPREQRDEISAFADRLGLS
jgi:hypothetical protein